MDDNSNWEKVILIRDPNEPEAMPVSFFEDMGTYKIGILEMEPQQDFGYHKGDKIEYFPYTGESGNTLLICDMDTINRVTRAQLEDGMMLKAAIAKFIQNRTRRNFINILVLLRDSFVWIPCNTVMDEKDQKRVTDMLEEAGDKLDSLKGNMFTLEEDMRLIPDILRKGDALFFPIFSSREEMGEYGNNFSKVKKHFIEAVNLAKNNKSNGLGIVVNAFSEPIVLNREICDIAENMESNLSE